MLTPVELNRYPNEVIALFEELQNWIVSDVSRRIAKTGNEALTATSVYQVQALYEIGAAMPEVRKKIAETNGIALKKVGDMFKAASINSFKREKTSFELAGKTLVFSTAKAQIIENSVKDIRKQILSFTGSIGMNGLPLEQAYHKALNTAYLQIATGASDYVSAIKRQVKELADSGLEFIDYASGHRNKLDVAVRRAVITGLKDTTNRISEINALEMGCDGYEISAHAGARPTHQVWQGRQFAISRDDSKGYPVYGDVVGSEMEDPYCRHSKWGIFLGITEPLYSDEELDNIDPPPFTCSIDGKEYTSYTASQKQRSIERAIRQTKREINGYTAAGLDAEALAAKAKLRQQTELYRQFSKEAGLLEQPERLGVYGGKLSPVGTTEAENAALKLSNAKSITDLSDYVKEKWGVKEVQISDLDFDAIKGTFEAMDRAIEQYPQLRGRIARIIQTSQNTYMTSDVSEINGKDYDIEIGVKKYGSLSALQKDYARLLKNNFTVQGTTWESTGVHELGHILNGIAIDNNAKNEKQAIADWNGDITASRIVDEAWKACKKEYPVRLGALTGKPVSDSVAKAKAKEDLSLYSAQGGSGELLAEAFRDVVSNGEKAKPISRAVVNILDRETMR